MTSRRPIPRATGRADESETQFSAANIFDNLGRLLAIGMPRREAVGLIVKGLAAAALAQLGVRSAWAATTCPCQATGQLYDPATACCTASGVQQKNPITNLAACPNRVPQPGFVPVPNGCGGAGSWLSSLVPNSFGAASFLGCCNTHDICYSTCASPSAAASAKATCDTNLGSCVNAACDAAYPPGSGMLTAIKNSSCHAVANRYQPAVSSYGQQFFDGGQMESCACCSTSTCATSCATPGTCGGFSACGPGDCICGSTTEGAGACVHGNTPCAGIQPCTSSSQCPSGYACFAATCCGSSGVCGPLCAPVLPGAQSVRTRGTQATDIGTPGGGVGPTIGSPG